jgi:hypothetical protein
MGESENVKRVGRGEEVVTKLLFRRKLLTLLLSRRQTQIGSRVNSVAFDVRLEQQVRRSEGWKQPESFVVVLKTGR